MLDLSILLLFIQNQNWMNINYSENCTNSICDGLVSKEHLLLRQNYWPDNVFSLAANQFEVQLESKAVQRQVPQPAELPHLIREGPQARISTHIQGGEAFQQTDLRRDLDTEDTKQPKGLIWK